MTTRSVRENGLRVAANIRLLRLTKGLTALDLSQLLQVSPSSVSESERGIRRINVDDLYDYAKALGVPVASLLTDEWAVTGTAPRPSPGLCSCAFLPDPHIWGASCPQPGVTMRAEKATGRLVEAVDQPGSVPGQDQIEASLGRYDDDTVCTCKGMGEHVRGTGLCLWVGVAEGPGQL